MSGWVKLYRKIWDWPYSSKPDYVVVWVYLLTHAAHQEYDTFFNGSRITIRKGQLVAGRKAISEKTGVKESKIQRILKCLENEQQIEQQTCPSGRLIYLPRWDSYQESEQPNEQQVNNKRTTSEQQVNTIQELKKDKKVKNTKKETDVSKKTKRKTGIPDDFAPDYEYAKEYGISNPEFAFEIYRDTAIAKNYLYTDWNLAWKDACRSWLPEKVRQAEANRVATPTEPEPQYFEPANRSDILKVFPDRTDLVDTPWSELNSQQQQVIVEKCKQTND